jgi:FMN phosphatase YigB (HAD superfamily)
MIESYRILDILDHIDKTIAPEDHLIVFDIDNTIIESIDQLASTQWFEAMIQRKMKLNDLTEREALQQTLPLNYLLVKHSMIQPIEPSTVSLIKQLQDNQHKVIALTARAFDPLKECTIEHLNKVDIDFTRTCIYPKDIAINARTQYSSGIIFTDGDHKGNVLRSFMITVGYTPKKIIFVDDKQYNHCAIKDAFQETNLTTTCIWYRYCAEKETQFDLTLTECRLLYLCETHPEINASYQEWLNPAKK